MNAEEIIANARSKGWRIEKTGKGKDARFRAYCHDGRSTAAPTTTLAATARLIDVARSRKRLGLDEALAFVNLLGIRSLDDLASSIDLWIAAGDAEGENTEDLYFTCEALHVIRLAEHERRASVSCSADEHDCPVCNAPKAENLYAWQIALAYDSAFPGYPLAQEWAENAYQDSPQNVSYDAFAATVASELDLLRFVTLGWNGRKAS